MKRILLLVSLGIVYMSGFSQTGETDSWKIKWNKKLVLEARQEDPATSIIKIDPASLGKKQYCLEVIYKEASKEKEESWIRTILIMDENDNSVLRKDSTRNLKIMPAEMKELFGDRKKLKVYTIAIPTDPDLAARIRVRRVLLCTLELQ